MKVLRVLVAAAVLVAPTSVARAADTSSRVIVVTLDGLRWQEMFGGADDAYFKRNSKGEVDPVSAKYAGDTKDGRRVALMPFVWNTIAKQGQIFGDPAASSRSHVTNGLWFSYPGYNELLTGAPDPRVDSNRKVPNPNVSVLEWLNGRPGFEGRVAAFGAWDVLPFILNTERSHLPVGTGFRPVPDPRTPREREINEMAADLPPYWPYGTFDAPIVYAAMEAMRNREPRVLYVLLGDGDEWAHESRYDLYLDAARRADGFIERLWTLAQSLPGYRGNTTLLITTDHGRGATLKDWSDHGKDIPAAEDTWIAALGPAVPALGVRKNLTVTTAQFAATIAAAVGGDLKAANPRVAPPLPLSR